jgi:DNA-binding response OmpR family regulator/predicted regulator of Ras-like GTPase activity (Roadblock/LC7/MglB family)
MSDVWRIFVVEGDESLNQSLVTSLRKDGYIVQGAVSGVDAVRVLWSEEYDVVIYDLKTPGADGFELLQWFRAYRPSTHMIIVGGADAAASQLRALEGGAVSYLEDPLDFRVLKEELRRLLQKTGFSASLDSFDLLDVIQIITMSRKSIALLVNTGLEERGLLRFQNGELVWAEYGILRGEEAFFALAAHKNGTVTHQPWNEPVVTNVMQPLSRLIFQALQYRTKYANSQQYSGEIESIQASSIFSAEIDDTPFLVLPASQPQLQTFPIDDGMGETFREPGNGDAPKEWWEQTGRVAQVDMPTSGSDYMRGESALNAFMKDSAANMSSQGFAPVVKQRVDLPSWLTDQPTASNLPTIKPTDQSNLESLSAIPATPAIKNPTGEWGPARDRILTTDQLQPRQPSSPQHNALFRETESLRPSSLSGRSSQPLSPSIQDNYSVQPLSPSIQDNYSVQPLSPSIQDSDSEPRNSRNEANSGPLASFEAQDANPMLSSDTIKAQQVARRNYAALVSALQTLGYTIAGFVAAAVVTSSGLPIAQVAVDDMDISKLCKYFSAIQKSVLSALDQEEWGDYEDTIITSGGRYIMMRMIGNEKKSFLVLMTTRDADPVECLTIIGSVEETINSALRQ